VATVLHSIFVSKETKQPKRRKQKKFVRVGVPCACRLCQETKTLWPAYYVGSSGWSWECWLEQNPPADDQVQVVPRNERQALSHGLTIRVRRRRLWKADSVGVLRGRCPRCEGLMPKGAEYCRSCSWQVQMAEECE
jgi:hypothetical protein